MTREQLQQIFRKAYDAQTWQDMLIELFGASDIKATPTYIENNNNDKADGFILGEINTSDRYKIGLFAFEVKNSTNIELNRVGLRSLVRSYTKYEVDAALVVYHNKTHWRLSFICDIPKEGEQTDSKRYTYVFGNVQESYRTAADRLAKLTDTTPTFEVIKDAFSVEKMSKDFFYGYKSRYDKFCDEIGATDKSNRDYVKKMMGRLVFLQFLQKRGWMNSDQNYMQNLYSTSAHQADFLKEVLEPLFFHVLNTKESERNHPKLKNLGEEINIPYLNGGLFEADNNDKRKIKFSANLFKDLFEFFSHYNFTIDENDPNDAEVGIDPEMLGHIFENLLEDNKDKGAFYTPKEIVQYMCRQSLIKYLQSKLGKHTEIENFINTHETGDRLSRKNFIIQNAKEIERLLDEVKICDPAIGSGAFPMGVLNEIFHAKMALDMNLNRAEVKKQIIQNNIYGVDIEQGAVDIARLRFWLSLVVDEKEPQPLPNLDYKIMCGNSLLSRYALDTSFDDVFKEYNQGKSEEDKMTLERYKRLVSYYTVTSDHAQKLTFRTTIEEIKNAFRTELSKKEWTDLIKARKRVFNLEAPMLFGERTKKEKAALKKAKVQLAKLEKEQADIINNELYKDTFEWRFEFPQLLDNDGNFTGFDIVIGNPPYINVEKIEEVTKKTLFKEYSTCKGRTDIYVAFVEKGMRILAKQGTLSYIIPYAFTNQKYGTVARKQLIDNHSIIEIVDTSDYMVFESANVKNIILFAGNATQKEDTKIKRVTCEADFIASKMVVSKINQLEFLNLKDYRFDTKHDSLNDSLRIKINSGSAQLEDICLVAYGARLNHKKEKISKDNYVSKEFIDGYKPFVEGKNIARYHFSQFGWLNYQPNEHYNPMFSELFENEKIMFINVVKDRLRFAIDTDNFYNSHTIVNCVKWNLLTNGTHTTIRRNITDKKINISDGISSKYLLALLNSNLMSWYFATFLSESLHFYPDDAKQLPIKVISKEEQQPFIDLVDMILETKKQDPSADTTEIEQQIDQMVYKLYNLTEEEIALIENQ